MKALFLDPAHLHTWDRMYLATGRLILKWAEIDLSVQSAINWIWRAAEYDEAERVLPESFRRRLALMHKLVAAHNNDPQVRREANQIVGTINRLKKVRDAMAHSRVMPGFDNEPNLFLGHSQRGKNRPLQLNPADPHGGVFGPRISLDRLEADLEKMALYPARITGLWGRTVKEIRKGQTGEL